MHCTLNEYKNCFTYIERLPATSVSPRTSYVSTLWPSLTMITAQCAKIPNLHEKSSQQWELYQNPRSLGNLHGFAPKLNVKLTEHNLPSRIVAMKVIYGLHNVGPCLYRSYSPTKKPVRMMSACKLCV